MKLLWHFLKRDARDNVVHWILVVFFAISYVLALPVANTMVLKVELPMGAMFACLISMMAYQQGIWIDSGVAVWALPRFYLQSLPVRRSTMFLLCFARGAVGGLPLIVFLLFQWPAVFFSLYVSSGKPNTAAVIAMALFLVCTFQLVAISANAFQERIRRATRRGSRASLMFRYFFWDMPLDLYLPFFGAALAWVSLYRGWEPLWLLSELAILGVIAWRVRRLYVAWLWG
jgi:hypothetical protein